MSSEEDVVRNVMRGGYSPNLPYENGVNGITSKMNIPGYFPKDVGYKAKEIMKAMDPINKIKNSYNKSKDYFLSKIMLQGYLAPQH